MSRRARPGLLVSTLLAAAFLAAAHLTSGDLRADVRISEIAYDTPDDGIYEFIELHNPDDVAVEIGGWSLSKGVRVRFPSGVRIEARGYLVVARSAELAEARYSLPPGSAESWADSSLENAGETITLVDASGVIVDELEYNDEPPWDRAARGGTLSLQRLCLSHDTNAPHNWIAAPPTPGAPGVTTTCPPIAPRPAIAIHEIHYHPEDSDDPGLEYVELKNTTGATIALGGYRFIDGFDFEFPPGITLGAGEYLVVCQDAARVASELGVSNTIGDFVGQLSNDGERITLVDVSGALVDSVRYRDSGDWPVAADGLGWSLEKIVADAPSDDPASWTSSGEIDGGSWRTLTTTGTLSSDELLLYLSGPGTVLVDDVSIRSLESPAVEHVANGSFDANASGWMLVGNHASSAWDAATGSLRIVATGAGSGVSSSVQTVLVGAPVGGETIYRISLRYRFLESDELLTARLVRSSPSRGLYADTARVSRITPGAANNATLTALPPFPHSISRDVAEPDSSDLVRITARVRSALPFTARIVTSIGGVEGGEPMRDDGLAGDAVAGDGVYTARLARRPHDTQVRFRIVAESSAGARQSPPVRDPSGWWGYYVYDQPPDSPLRVYHLLLGPELGPDARTAIARLNCETYRRFSFAYRGDLYPDAEIRRRGQSVCGDPDVIKKYMKIRFNKGRELRGQRRMNLQSLWTDKSLIRENMAWTVFRELGFPSARHEHVRLHANGDYFGLYAEMDDLDERWLEREGLNPDGNLYKAVQSNESLAGIYEKVTNEDEDSSDLTAFLQDLHAARPGAELRAFFAERVVEDDIIDYLAGHVLINNGDYGAKNHYLYHDLDTQRWRVIAWDLDLSYGKRWDGNFGGVLNDRLNSPGISPWNSTSVGGGGVGNHLLDKFFAQAGTHYRRAHVIRLADALEEKYPLAVYDARIDGLRDLLLDEQADDIAEWGRSPATADNPSAPAEFLPNLEIVRNHIAERRAYLLGYLRDREGYRGHDSVKITEIAYNPPGPDDAEFLEIWNHSPSSIDISGWSIEGLESVDATTGALTPFVFPPGSTVLRDEVFIVAKNPVVFRLFHGDAGRVFGPYPGQLSNQGERLRIKDDGPGHPATIDHVVYSTRSPWPEEPDGLGATLELTEVARRRDNDPAHAWRASRTFGGSPWRIERPGEGPPDARHADCNADGRVDLSDAVRVVRLLFAGASVPCAQSCDADRDGSVRVADAVLLLRHLFESAVLPDSGTCAPASEDRCGTSSC